MKYRWFNVFLNGKKIDSIYQHINVSTLKDTAEEVRRSLIEHDGYDSEIQVRVQRKRPIPWTPDEFTEAYIKTMLRVTDDESTPEGGEPLDKNYSMKHFTKASLQKIRKDCEVFQKIAGERLQERGLVHAGHDFWLTREGHGAGFWDGDWPENGDFLTDLSELFQEQYISVYRNRLYVDDGRVPLVSETQCDECNVYTPVIPGGGISNCWHKESCSLFDFQKK